MKALSEIISTVIITSTIIIVSILIYYMAMSALSYSIQVSEYGYLKSTIINIASNVPEIIKGTNFLVSVPRGTVGVGYHINNNTIYEVDLLTTNGWNNITVDPSPTAIEIRSYKVVVSTNRLVYGSNNLTVNDLAYIPSVWEYYKDGVSIINFNTSRFYIQIFIIENNTSTEIYVKIQYIQLRTRYVSGPRTLLFIPGGTVLNRELYDVQDIVIREVDPNTGKTIRSYQPNHIFNLGYQVNVLVIVNRIYVVMT